jgi:hypothetical protein
LLEWLCFVTDQWILIIYSFLVGVLSQGEIDGRAGKMPLHL